MEALDFDVYSSFLLLSLLLLLMFLFRYCIAQNLKLGSKAKLPPGPMKLPLIGNLHNLAGSTLPHHAFRVLAKQHGPLMHLQLGEGSVAVISSPEMAEEVLKTHDVVFAQRPETVASRILTFGTKDIAFSPQGDYWRQMRKICTMELLGPKRVQSFSAIRHDEVSKFIESIRAFAGRSMDFTEKIFLLTSVITCRATLGDRCKDQDAVISLTKEGSLLAGGFNLVDLYPSLEFLLVVGLKPKLEKVLNQINKILDSIIDEHKENLMGNSEAVEEDLVDVLLRLQGSGTLKCSIENTHIKAVLWDMFFAGTDSSSTIVEWAMAEMMKNPRVLKKAQAEIRQGLKGKKTITEADIQELNYLKSVIKETMRLHPPAPLLLPRESRERCEIDGYVIPAKTKVMVNAWAIMRDPEYWQDAENFIPERFNDNNSFDFRGTNFTYMPFGSGKRICPGVSFGVANVELPLANLLYHFNWELPDGITPQNLDMTEVFGATVGRKNHLYLIATPYIPSYDD